MEAQVKEGQLYKERNPAVKFPKIIRVRKIAAMGPLTYVFYMAENQAAMSAHPNGSFIPLESFLNIWELVDAAAVKGSRDGGSRS